MFFPQKESCELTIAQNGTLVNYGLLKKGLVNYGRGMKRGSCELRERCEKGGLQGRTSPYPLSRSMHPPNPPPMLETVLCITLVCRTGLVSHGDYVVVYLYCNVWLNSQFPISGSIFRSLNLGKDTVILNLHIPYCLGNLPQCGNLSSLKFITFLHIGKSLMKMISEIH